MRLLQDKLKQKIMHSETAALLLELSFLLRHFHAFANKFSLNCELLKWNSVFRVVKSLLYNKNFSRSEINCCTDNERIMQLCFGNRITNYISLTINYS